METTETTNAAPNGARPTFLAVICILTFIGSGYGIVKAIQGYTTADAISTMTTQMISDTEDKMDSEKTPSFVKSLMGSVTENVNPGNIRKSSIVNLISNILTLIGGIMMWNLKKNGFYLYIVGIIILAIAPMIILGKGLLGGISTLSIGFFGVVFIVMYAVNLKHMTK